MVECIHEMDPTTCTYCSGRGADLLSAVQGSPMEAEASGPTIEAKYDGTCAHCRGTFSAGDSITHSNDAGGWCITSHTTKADSAPRRRRERDDGPPRLRNDLDLSGF